MSDPSRSDPAVGAASANGATRDAVTRGIRVAIVGGGAAGVAAALAFADAGGDRLAELSVVERAAVVGPGLAYGAAEEHHRLNSPAGKMSIRSDSDDFLAWCAADGIDTTAGDFELRAVYGRYLADAFARLVEASAGRVRHVRADATDVRRPDVSAAGRAQFEVVTSAGAIAADVVVLALGNAPSREVSWVDERGVAAEVVQNPWASGEFDRIALAQNVLLFGTGLTMVDVATSLARRAPQLSMTATSRRLELPRRHLDPEHPAPAAQPPRVEAGAGLTDILRDTRARLRDAAADDVPWQRVVDAMRPAIGDLWSGLEADERRRFLEHVSRHWEVHRHRMAPDVASELDALLASGRLRVRAVHEGDAFDVVVNCTGPRPVGDPGWNAVVDALTARGDLRPDELGLGIDVDAAARVVDAAGASIPNLYALGPALRGAFWEETAVPEIRNRAHAIARDVFAR